MVTTPRAEGASGIDRRFVAALVTIAAVQLVSALGSFYLATDDWLLVTFGRDADGLDALFERQTVGPPAIRPLSLGKAWLEHTLFGEAVAPRLAVHVLMHALCAGLLMLSLVGLGARPAAAGWTGLAFAAYPVHAEALAWYHSGHTAILWALLSVLAVAAWARRWPGWIAPTALAAALLTRENAIVCIPILLVAAHRRRGTWRKALADTAPCLAVLAAYGAVRSWQILSALGSDSGAFLPFTERPVAGAVYALFTIVIPGHPANGAFWLCVGTCGAVWATVAIYRPTGWRWALAATLVLVAPFLPFYPGEEPLFSADGAGYERRWYTFYLPVAALAWCVGSALADRPRLAAALVSALLLVQLTNLRWWRDLGAGAADSYATLTNLAERKRPLSFELEATGPLAEVVEHQVVDMPRLFPALVAPVYRKKPDEERWVRATRDRFGYPSWEILPEVFRPPEETIRVVWKGGYRLP